MSRYTHAHTAMDRRFLSLSPSSSSITHACLPVCARSVTRWRGGGRASLLAGGNLTLASEAVVSHIRQESLYSRARACARVSHQHTSSHRRIGGGGSDGATRQNATRPLTSTGTVGEARALLVYHHHHHLSLTEERVESWRRRRHALASHHSLSPPTLALLGGVDARSETAVGGGCEATRNRLVTHTTPSRLLLQTRACRTPQSRTPQRTRPPRKPGERAWGGATELSQLRATLGQTWRRESPVAAMCVRKILDQSVCNSQYFSQLAAFFIDPVV